MTGERIKRLATNALTLAAAAFVGVIAESTGQIDLALILAAATAAVWAIVAVLAKLAGFVTPGNPIVINAVLFGLAAGASNLIASGELTTAALVAAGNAVIRGAAGGLLSVSDHPKPEPLPD